MENFSKKTSDKESILVDTANIEAYWHLYSQEILKSGPISTLFSFTGDQRYLKKGNTKEEEGHTVDNDMFDFDM